MSDSELRVSDRGSVECSPIMGRSMTSPVSMSPRVCAVPFGRAHCSLTRLTATEKSTTESRLSVADFRGSPHGGMVGMCMGVGLGIVTKAEVH